MRAEGCEPRRRRAVRHGKGALCERRLEFILIELPGAGRGAGLPPAALLRVLHDPAGVIIEARDQCRGIRAGSGREAWLIRRVGRPHVQAEIIDRQLRGLLALLERGLDLLPQGGVLLGGHQGLLHRRTLDLPGGDPVLVAHAGRHLARRAGGAEERVLEQGGVTVGDVGRRLRGAVVAHRSTDVQIHSLRRFACDRLARQVEVHATLSAFQVEIHAAGRRTAHRAGTREQGILGRELLAHDEDLLPLPGRGLGTGVRQLACRVQELVLVAPHEEYF